MKVIDIRYEKEELRDIKIIFDDDLFIEYSGNDIFLIEDYKEDRICVNISAIDNLIKALEKLKHFKNKKA